MGPPRTRSAQLDSGVLPTPQPAAILTPRSPSGAMSSIKQPPPGNTAHPSEAAILAAIAECKTSLTAKIDYVATDVGLIRQDQDKLRAWISVVEDWVSGVEDLISSDSRELRAQQLQIRALQKTGHRHRKLLTVE